MIETPETLYEYFEKALEHVLSRPKKVERKALAADAGVSVQYLSQILNPKVPTKASLDSQKKIAAASGYTYAAFLQLGKNLFGSTGSLADIGINSPEIHETIKGQTMLTPQQKSVSLQNAVEIAKCVAQSSPNLDISMVLQKIYDKLNELQEDVIRNQE